MDKNFRPYIDPLGLRYKCLNYSEFISFLFFTTQNKWMLDGFCYSVAMQLHWMTVSQTGWKWLIPLERRRQSDYYITYYFNAEMRVSYICDLDCHLNAKLSFALCPCSSHIVPVALHCVRLALLALQRWELLFHISGGHQERVVSSTAYKVIPLFIYLFLATRNIKLEQDYFDIIWNE